MIDNDDVETVEEFKVIHKDYNGVTVCIVTEGHHYMVMSNGECLADVIFQDGPVPSNGINGITNEALLAIIINRTVTLNNKFPCEENENAISFMRDALGQLNLRTYRRIARDVEGKAVI